MEEKHREPLVQISVRVRQSDINALREIAARPDVDREWAYLLRKAMQEFIERDQAQQREKPGGAS